jgi:hypothetical protein
VVQPQTPRATPPTTTADVQNVSVLTATPIHLRLEQPRALGRALRKGVPREAHAIWQAPADRRSPVDVLEGQAASRLPELIPVRYGRCLSHPLLSSRAPRR